MDRRFAIVIGINDYDLSPLSYCAEDANSIATILQEKCKFPHDNIFTIISKNNAPIRDITGHLDAALKKIAENFRPHIDSIFFYFAGHGQNLDEKSNIVFHDSEIKIGLIFDKINELQPKLQTYVIDACESGGKVIMRKPSLNQNLIDHYIKQSSGVLFMFAATDKQSAFEQTEKKHGIFTYYFLDAINNASLYDEDNILTPGRIQDYIAHQLSKKLQFDQTPVIESRVIGYYPFAFLESEHTEMNHAEENQSTDPDGQRHLGQSLVDKEYFPDVSFDIRRGFFEDIRSVLEVTVQEFAQNFERLNYNLSQGNDIDLFGYDVSEKILSDLIFQTRNNDVYAMHGVFIQEQEEVKPNPFLGSLGILNSLLKNNEPTYRELNRIDYSDSKVLCHSLFLKSPSTYMVSAGIALFIYQATYGIGFAASVFHYDNKSYKDTNICGPKTIVKPIIYNTEANENISKNFQDSLTKFLKDVKSWNSKREKEINLFASKAK